MRIELYHGSKYGNGARVAEEFKRLMAVNGVDVAVHHIKDSDPHKVPPADLYVFGSPTHFGKAPGNVLRFIGKFDVRSGTRYALIATCSSVRPDKKTGLMPPREEVDKNRRTIPMMDEELRTKGLVKVAEMTAFVNPDAMKGPLENGWKAIVEEFSNKVLEQLSASPGT
jgi:hypothetical protein